MNLFATYFGMAKGTVGHNASGSGGAHGNGASAALLDASNGPVGPCLRRSPPHQRA